MKRRDLLKALPVAGVAMAVPAFAGQAMSAQERVRFHFEAMADALNEITAETHHGWHIQAGDKSSGGLVPHWDHRWLSVRGLILEKEYDPRLKGGEIIIDRGHDLESLRYQRESTRPALAKMPVFHRLPNGQRA